MVRYLKCEMCGNNTFIKTERMEIVKIQTTKDIDTDIHFDYLSNPVFKYECLKCLHEWGDSNL